MKLSDLIRDEDGRASHTRLWSNIAYGAMTVIYVRVGWYTTSFTEGFAWATLAFGAIVGGSQIASKFFAWRAGIKESNGATKPGGA